MLYSFARIRQWFTASAHSEAAAATSSHHIAKGSLVSTASFGQTSPCLSDEIWVAERLQSPSTDSEALIVVYSSKLSPSMSSLWHAWPNEVSNRCLNETGGLNALADIHLDA